MKTLQVLFISGNWNNEEGRSSKYMSIVSDFVSKKITGHVDIYNGGNLNDLKKIMEEKVPSSEVVFWFPNIPSELREGIKNPKDYNPSCTLINYKRNDNNRLTYDDLRSLAIANKADLTCEVFKDDTGRYQMRVFDSNDTIVSDFTQSTGKSITDLISRIYILRSLAYSKLIHTGELIDIVNPNFNEIAEKYIEFGEVLANKLNNQFIKRHLGEIAFRGNIDPVTKSNDIVYVSARHVRRDELTPDDKSKFVATRLLSNKINYYGEAKPCFNCSTYSRILSHLPKVNYIFFSNFYIDGARYTEKVLPSQCVQQVQEISNLIINNNYESNFAINLLGCGSMIFINSLEELDKYYEKLIQRDLPEMITPDYEQIINDDGVNTFINILKERPLINGELLDIRFEDGSTSVYKIQVKEYQDNQEKLHQEAVIKVKIKGIQTELPIIGLYARRV